MINSLSRRILISAFFVGMLFALDSLEAQPLQISGGVDTRFRSFEGRQTFELDGAFINLRKVLADSSGDRVILVAQYDFEDNFKNSHFYNTYVQIKGPLGRINGRLGRYILPFGLLAYYDTERLLLHTLDSVSLGIKTDLGASLTGFLGEFDYAFSISNGTGKRWEDIDNNKLILGRVGIARTDTKVGLSYLNGFVSSFHQDDITPTVVYKERIGVDIEHFAGVTIVRGELTYGRDGNESVSGAFIGSDYALSPRLEINFKYGLWDAGSTWHLPGLGISYKVVEGAFVRLADTFQVQDGTVKNNEVQVQFYAEFLEHL